VRVFLPFSDEELQDLDAKFGDIRRVTGKTPPAKPWAKAGAADPEPPYQVVFRKPEPAETDAYEGAAHNEEARKGALRTLARSIVVGVSLDGKHTLHDGERRGASEKAVREAWDALRKRSPLAHLACQEALTELCGAAAEASGEG
jgi:hypothetical protein